MTRFSLLGLFLLLFGALTSDLQAQTPDIGDPVPVFATGEYEITNTDGTPIRAGKTVGSTVVQVGPGVYVGWVWIEDEDDPDTRQVIAGENFVMTPYAPGAYSGTNDRGNSFELVYNSMTGKWTSVMTSGPNTGTARNWTPITN